MLNARPCGMGAKVLGAELSRFWGHLSNLRSINAEVVHNIGHLHQLPGRNRIICLLYLSFHTRLWRQ